MSVSYIPCNPEQSKYLETAAMRRSNTWINFVNLRDEEYNKDNRIPPKMKFGTLEVDVERRDLTINSLFYNIIRTKSIENLTGRGIADLKSEKIISH